MKNLVGALILILGIIIGSAMISCIDKVPDRVIWGVIYLAIGIGVVYVLWKIFKSRKGISHWKSITWFSIVLIIFILSFSPQQTKAITPRYTALGWTKANIARSKANAIWKGKKHRKHHRHIIKGNGRTMKVNHVSTCPLSKR